MAPARPVTSGIAFEPWSSSLAAEWDALAAEQGVEPFLRPGWVGATAAAFFPQSETLLLVARTHGRLDAVLPMLRRRLRLDAPVNWQTPAYGPVFRDHDALTRLAVGLMEQPAHRIRLRFLDPGDVLTVLTAAAARSRRRTLQVGLERSPHIDVSHSWEDYQQRFSGSWRRNVRRRWRRLADAGDVSFEITDGGGDLPALLDEGLRVEASSWKGDRGTAIASDPATTRFYAHVARWAQAEGMLRLAFLRVDGRAAAFVILLEHKGALYALKTAYDPAYANCGPGTLHMLHIIEYACGSPHLTSLELLGAEDAWKLELADGSRERITWIAFAPGSVGRLERSASVLAAHAKRSAAERVPQETWERLSDARRRFAGTAARVTTTREGAGPTAPRRRPSRGAPS
jgi:CelD/BcsL family acetyltransferase involved in cellulose biosynthesis